MTVEIQPVLHASAERDDHYRRIARLSVGALTLVRLLWLASHPTDLYVDEAQYWFWSLHPALGYYSKPPLIAWIIALTTAAFGESELGIRFAAPILHLATSLIVYGIGRRLYDARIGCWSAIAYASLPGVSFSAVIISTDVPLLTCWALALYAFIRAREAPGWTWWIVVGAAAGVGFLAKYAMAYWILSAFLFLLAVRDERRHLPRLAAASALALAVYAPNFLWNLTNGFVSYLHTKDNADLGGSLFHSAAFLEFFLSQFGVFGPVFFATLILVALGLRRLGRREKLLASFALPTLAMMLAVSFLSRAQPNWSAPTYVAAVVLVVAWLIERRRGTLVAASIALHLVAAVVLFGARDAAAAIGVALPAKYDALHRLRGWAAFGRSVAAILLQNPGATLLSDDRETMAALLYYVRPHPFDAVKWNPTRRIHDQFDLITDMEQHIGEDFIFVTQEPDMSWTALRFARLTPVATITVPLGPDRVRRYSVYLAIGFKGYRPS
jgi:4-amino-4-deoxy-L-arabinose transferase-like glycosyltransferase